MGGGEAADIVDRGDEADRSHRSDARDRHQELTQRIVLRHLFQLVVRTRNLLIERFDDDKDLLDVQRATLQPHGTTPFARAWGQGNGLNDFCMLPELGRPVEQVVSAA